jgi:hypothetical protein
MKIYDLHDKQGQVFAFEISSLVGRRGAQRIAARVHRARFIALPNDRRERIEGVFCLFEVGAVRFQIWEPFNDNSRFWIGPDPVQLTPHLAAVRDVFAEANPWAAFFAITG